MSVHRRMAALGSSFAAGPGIEPVLDAAAGRSAANYAHLLASALHADLTDLTVSGATTATILTERQRLRPGRTLAPQIDGLPADADLVTVTAGGNDIGYLGGLIGSAARGRVERLPAVGSVARRMHRTPPMPSARDAQNATAGLVTVVEEVRKRAPGARVVLVDYLTIIGDDTVPNRDVPMSSEDLAVHRHTGELLAGAFREAASISGADLVAVSQPSREHALGSAEPWIQPFRGLSGSSFHPNVAGMSAVAHVVHQHLLAIDG